MNYLFSCLQKSREQAGEPCVVPRFKLQAAGYSTSHPFHRGRIEQTPISPLSVQDEARAGAG
ncbi:hypothetical protein ACVBEH_29990, partial [Roseateles sp. GG27B]